MFLNLRFLESTHHARARAQFLRFAITSHFCHFHIFFMPKNLLKTLPKPMPRDLKIHAKNNVFFNIAFLGFWPPFWEALGSKWEPTWPFWSPRTLPKASKNQSWGLLGHLLASLARLLGGFWVPGLPRRRFWRVWGRARLDFGMFWDHVLTGRLPPCALLPYVFLDAVTRNCKYVCHLKHT